MKILVLPYSCLIACWGCVWQFTTCVLFIFTQNMIVVSFSLDEPERINSICAVKIIFLRTLVPTLPSESHGTFP